MTCGVESLPRSACWRADSLQRCNASRPFGQLQHTLIVADCGSFRQKSAQPRFALPQRVSTSIEQHRGIHRKYRPGSSGFIVSCRAASTSPEPHKKPNDCWGRRAPLWAWLCQTPVGEFGLNASCQREASTLQSARVCLRGPSRTWLLTQSQRDLLNGEFESSRWVAFGGGRNPLQTASDATGGPRASRRNQPSRLPLSPRNDDILISQMVKRLLSAYVVSAVWEMTAPIRQSNVFRGGLVVPFRCVGRFHRRR